MKVILIREKLLASWGKDSFTFGCLFVGWYLNHAFLSGSWVIDTTIGLMFIVCAIGSIQKHYTPREAIEVLKELIEKEKE